MNDLKFAFRQLLKNPGFTALAVLTLALGIGANTAIFSVVNGVLLKPLPYDQPGQLVQVWEAPQPGNWNAVTPGAFTDWKEGSTSLEALSLVTAEVMNFAGEGQPERLSGLMVSASYLQGSLIVRTKGPPLALVESIRKEILTLDPDQPVSNIRTMEQAISHSVSARRFTLTLLGIFAGTALGLAVIGLYGVMAYAVAQRAHEIGIRMALGAQRTDVLRLVLRQGMGLTLLGLAIGLAGALALTRVLRNHLYEVGPTDPATLACVSLLLVMVALFACVIPARRAANVDPMEALRYE